MSITEEIRKLAAEMGGNLSAPIVVESAKDKAKWPKMHERLWAAGLEELAMEARLARASQMIIRIEITHDDGPSVRQFVHIRGTPGYQTIDQLIAQPDLAAIKIIQIQEDIARMRSRLGALAALVPGTAKAIDTHLARAQKAAALPRKQPRPKGKAA
jgi:hypothetical protein